jgi:hypothetical protein
MRKIYHSEEDIKAEVEKKLGKKVNEVIWDILKEDGYIEEVLGGYENAFNLLLRRYRRQEKVYLEGAKAGVGIYGAQRLFPPPKKEDSPIPQADIVLSKLLAAKVSKLPFVKQFRREVLGGKLLQPDEIEGWIQATKEQDGPPTRYAKIRAKKVNVTIDKDNWWPLKIMPAFEADDVIGIEHEFLSYPSKKEWAECVPINVDGTLGRLKSVAGRIIKYYCPAWQEGQAVAFILTGQTPVIPKVRYGVKLTSSGGPCWVTLKFDARIKPQDLAREYSKIRRKIMGNSHAKPLTKKHQELAVFAAEHKEGLTWEKLMHKWNEKFPKWAYKNYRLFCRDAIGAINRLLNGKVNYASLLGSEAQKTTATRPPSMLLQ